MVIHIKNMVCDRCIMAVNNVLENDNIPVKSIRLGEVDLGDYSLTTAKTADISQKLKDIGFELIEDRKSRLIEQIKNIIIDQVHYKGTQLTLKMSAVLSEEMNYDYNYLSNLFSSVQGVTIEQFYIQQRIERAKELIAYDELNLSEIAYQLGYSSVAYLSTQFKNITGLTPTQFKKLQGEHPRKPLDKL